ncbi:CobW family GTP-binding protein [Thiosocius teredinicola]|uniref:CobW family GTP-binding protein n=1 Tax=Thiosocius teredinicola TaxID=1973002 RepID=UPI000990BEA8
MALIPVNLITGFLGVGKTTSVRHLLDHHPANERWAVLVNEFGDVGIDGALLGDEGVVVQEVAGGCLCCVSAPAFTTGLNRLIRQHRPDRILIEPSGLGHPAQVLSTLTGPLYQQVLDVRATICIIDARHLASARHIEHPTFQDQIHLADVLVANKVDLYSDVDKSRFEGFANTLDPAKSKIGYTDHGQFDPQWLDLARASERRAAFPEAHAFLVETANEHDHQHAPQVDSEWLLLEGQADGYYRAGWVMNAQHPWSSGKLTRFLDGLGVERKKGVFRTDHGWQGYNQGAWQPASAPSDSNNRFEVIDADRIDVNAIDKGMRNIDADAAP